MPIGSQQVVVPCRFPDGAVPFAGTFRARSAMDFLQPTTWADALALTAELSDALPIAGGTDVMVELNFDKRRPGALLDLGRVAELREWSLDGGRVRLGAGVPYAWVIERI